MKETELKPCPFCGSEAIIYYPSYNTVAVMCCGWRCGAEVSIADSRNIESVVERWNRRANDEMQLSKG